VSVSTNWNASVVPFCGLLYSCPSGEYPVTVMKLSPQSRGFADNSGKPTWRLMLVPCPSWFT
jgi:hypothetical protein